MFILFCIITTKLTAQTWIDVTQQYIQNPSFEDYTACPQSNSAYPGSMWIDSVVGWYAPTQGTSDYFNACNTFLNGVPSNWIGSNVPSFDGIGYCGFLSYSLEPPNYSMWSEYIQSTLIKPLKSNTSYRFTMRIKRANGFNFAVQNIGANFSENANTGFSGTKPYNLIPTVLNTSGFLTDTLGWTLVSGQFIATGNENYLTIGWFGDTISSDFIFFIPPDIDTTNGDSLFLTETYYLVDSLTLSELIFDIENFNVNIITPNGDGKNDYLDFSVYDLKKLSFTVYNRWGNKVFNSDNAQLKWNGKNNDGKQLSDGTYFYLLNATLESGKQITKHQSITILY
ncbi:hypothetical protein AUJ10_01000 [Candidatus Pacearchaeota archaeon CG1_02_31_27]|nr:MAG: hypothetical protein AUJ10_01000 [Candidatus Pacearchaeota archaeon CG1_02_31_27]